MSRYELFQGQTTLFIVFMLDMPKQDTPKTCRFAEPQLNMTQSDTLTRMPAQESNASKCVGGGQSRRRH
ncbi:hypothetical protein R3I94_006475 [Phoxinus phoxinus]